MPSLVELKRYCMSYTPANFWLTMLELPLLLQGIFSFNFLIAIPNPKQSTGFRRHKLFHFLSHGHKRIFFKWFFVETHYCNMCQIRVSTKHWLILRPLHLYLYMTFRFANFPLVWRKNFSVQKWKKNQLASFFRWVYFFICASCGCVCERNQAVIYCNDLLNHFWFRTGSFKGKLICVNELH